MENETGQSLSSFSTVKNLPTPQPSFSNASSALSSKSSVSYKSLVPSMTLILSSSPPRFTFDAPPPRTAFANSPSVKSCLNRIGTYTTRHTAQYGFGVEHGPTSKILSDCRLSQTERADDQSERRCARAWSTIAPAMIAFVVAIAGMMLPAYSVEMTIHSVISRSMGKESKTISTFHLEPRLRFNVERGRPQVCRRDDKVQGIVIVLVETERFRAGRIDSFLQPLDPATCVRPRQVTFDERAAAVLTSR